VLALRAGLRARRMPVADQLLRLAGATGVTTSPLAPEGTVLVHHEQWSAVAEGEAIGSGEAVQVVAREGLKLRVRRVAGRQQQAG
jgi:membrane-bound ClpP family serine protease